MPRSIFRTVNRLSSGVPSRTHRSRLLPSRPPKLDDYVIAALNLPAKVVSGDYYDYMPLTHHLRDPDGEEHDVFGVMIADVTGHGTGAAVEAAMFDALLRTYAQVTAARLQRHAELILVSEGLQRLLGVHQRLLEQGALLGAQDDILDDRKGVHEHEVLVDHADACGDGIF